MSESPKATRKPARPPGPTAEVTAQIAGFVRAGGYPEVAAEAAGVPRDLFVRWMERGRARNAREPYRSFASAVGQALAQARLRAEIEARQKVPRFWLASGPGRERSDTPGWTSQVKPRPEDGADPLGRAEALIARYTQVVMTALEPFPEARAAVADALLAADSAPRKQRRRECAVKGAEGVPAPS